MDLGPVLLQEGAEMPLPACKAACGVGEVAIRAHVRAYYSQDNILDIIIKYNK